MDKKCIFLDIDGTVRDPFYGTPESALTAILKARENGHLAVICTGRPVGLIPDDFPVGCFDGIIAGGGCYIEKNGEILLDREIPADIAVQISGNMHDMGILHRIETKNRVYMEPEMADMLGFLGEKTNNSNSEMKQMIAEKNKFGFKYTIEDFLDSPVNTVKMCTVSSAEALADIKRIFGHGFNMISHYNDDGTVNTEIVQKGCDKGSGIRLFCESLGIDLKNTIAFGDSMNDIDMFKAVNIKAAMRNGEPELKKMADIICGDILDNGLYTGFVKAGLI